MREAAALSGLYVEYRELPGKRLDNDYRTGELIYYGKRLPSRLAGAVHPHYWIREADGEWRGENWRLPLPVCLDSLPAGIVAVGIDRVSCGVYWVESDSLEDVEQICLSVQNWCESLDAD